MDEKAAYDEIFNFLYDGSYLSDADKDQKRNIRKKAGKFILNDGALFYVGSTKGNSSPRRWVSDAEEQREIIAACHGDKFGGHFGRDKTRDNVCQLTSFT